GTRDAMARLGGQRPVGVEDCRPVGSGVGATIRQVRFPIGERGAVEWMGTEPLTVPRHTRGRNVRSYVCWPGADAGAGDEAEAAAPPARPVARSGPQGPTPEERAKARFAVVAEAHGPQGDRRVTLTGRDPYSLTGLLIARGAQLFRDGRASPAGALAPAEAFDARTFLDGLAPLLEIAAVEEL